MPQRLVRVFLLKDGMAVAKYIYINMYILNRQKRASEYKKSAH